nr:sigma factor-like helix-turn-helix DNA-binding protein [Clostridium sp. DL-VIII]
MSTKDIAKLLKISDGTVRSRLTRARTKLREIIGEVEI